MYLLLILYKAEELEEICIAHLYKYRRNIFSRRHLSTNKILILKKLSVND